MLLIKQHICIIKTFSYLIATDGVNYNIAAAPLYFVRSGAVVLAYTAGTFRLAGLIGYEWSSRVSPSSNTLAYWFEFNATESRPSWGPNNRYNGLPLRWFCRGGVPIF